MSNYIRTLITPDEMKPGDRIVRNDCYDCELGLFVGRTSDGDLVTEDRDGSLSTWKGSNRWFRLDPKPTPPPLPEYWMNYYAHNGWWGNHHKTEEAARDARARGCLAVIHVWTDDDGNDHAEIERVEP